MGKLVTVKTFTYTNELAIIKSLLDSEDIYYFVQDELTTQMNPLYSNAVGGIRLQVREEDVERTIHLLKEGGFLKDSDMEPSKSYLRIHRFLSGIPFLKRFFK